MKPTLVKTGTFLVAAALLFTACNTSSSGGFKTDSITGVHYRFIVHTDKGQKPVIGDYAHVKMVYTAVTPAGRDSEIFNTAKNRRPMDTTGTIVIPLMKTFNGCVEQAITLMSVGDSAVFQVNADSLYIKTFHQKEVPKFIKPGSALTFYIKLASFQTRQQLQADQQQQMQKRMVEMQQRKAAEPASIAKYLSDNHYTNIKPTSDSLFILKTKGGNKHNPIMNGDSIYVTYTGTLMDGTVFDASSRHSGALKMVYSPTMRLIKGWIEALKNMSDGEEAMILVPSSLAYGARQAGPMILPYTPLVFELTVVKVKRNK